MPKLTIKEHNLVRVYTRDIKRKLKSIKKQFLKEKNRIEKLSPTIQNGHLIDETLKKLVDEIFNI